MKLISWNVNGIRACIGKGFEWKINAEDEIQIGIEKTSKGLKRALQHLMRIFSACRKRNASRGR